MRELRNEFDIARMAEYFGVSRAGFYRFVKRQPSARELEDRSIGRKIVEIYDEHRRIYGIDRLHPAVRDVVVCGRNRVRRLMKKLGIRGRIRRRFRVMTTNSAHTYRISPNLLRRNFRAAAPNAVWVSDITYIATREGWLYLCVVVDLYSRKIVGWSMRSDLGEKLVLDAFGMAVARRAPGPGLVFHSDRGVQYAAASFRDLLKKHGVVQSMSRKGNCLDNACAESIFATIKTELEADMFWSRAEARALVFEYIETFYNRIRLHSYLGYASPDEFEKRGVA